MKIAIVSDSNSGLEEDLQKKYDIHIIPMPFIVDGNEYHENKDLTQKEFYKYLKENKEVSTSQPSEYEITSVWDELLKEYDEIVHIPMSSALSMSTESAKKYAERYNDKVQVVDNKRISITLKSSLIEARYLANESKTAKEIKEILEKNSGLNSIYIMVPTLKYLKKGGRITPATAALGTLLGIKPVLTIQCGKLDTFAKVLNVKQAETKMIAQIKKEIETRFSKEYKENKLHLAFAHSDNEIEIEHFKQMAIEALPKIPIFSIDPLPLSIACHIGAKSVAIALAVSDYPLI